MASIHSLINGTLIPSVVCLFRSVGILLFSLALLSPEAVQSQSLKRIRILYVSISGSYAVPFLTKEAGLFEKNGLDVELLLVKSGSLAAKALIASQAHIVQMAGPAVVQAALAGGDTIMIAGVINMPDFSLVVPKSIRPPDDLRGMKVGTGTFGGSTDFLLRLALERLGLKPHKDVAFIQVSGTSADRLAAMKVGAIHATVLSTGEKLNALRQGFHELFNLSRMDYAYPAMGLITTRSIIRTEDETLRSFMRAYIEGIKVYKTQRDFTVSVLRKFLRIDDMALLSNIYDAYYQMLPRTPYPTTEGIRNILSELSVVLPKAKTARPEDFVEPRFVKELDETGFIDRLYR